MNAKAREIAQKIKDNAFDPWTMNKEARQYMGAFDLDEAESIIAEALAERDKEIARMRGAIATFAKGQSWAATGWKEQAHIKPLFDIAHLLPPAEKEVER